MTLRLQKPLSALLMGLFLLVGSAQAQPADELAAMKERALQAAISSMNLANDPSSDIAYDGQPGDGATKQGYLDPEYFNHVEDYHFVLRRGKRASKAVDAIFRGPTRLECNTMMIAIEYRAIQAAIGDERFDRVWRGRRKVRIEIAAARQTRVLGRYLRKIRRPSVAKTEPGDWVYFANHDEYLYKHPAGAWQGENALCVGFQQDGTALFSGFGVHEVTAEEMNLELLKAYNAPRSSEDHARALAELTPLERKRVDWMSANSIVAAGSEDEAVSIAAAALEMSEDDLEYDVVQDGASGVLIAVFYQTPTEDYPEEIELEDVQGLIQCFRLDFEKLQGLGLPAATASAAPEQPSGVSSFSGGLAGALGN